jgi:hypothetical protein
MHFGRRWFLSEKLLGQRLMRGHDKTGDLTVDISFSAKDWNA